MIFLYSVHLVSGVSLFCWCEHRVGLQMLMRCEHTIKLHVQGCLQVERHDPQNGMLIKFSMRVWLWWTRPWNRPRKRLPKKTSKKDPTYLFTRVASWRQDRRETETGKDMEQKPDPEWGPDRGWAPIVFGEAPKFSVGAHATGCRWEIPWQQRLQLGKPSSHSNIETRDGSALSLCFVCLWFGRRNSYGIRYAK